MKTRTMSPRGPKVSVIGLGTMSWPGCHFGQADGDPSGEGASSAQTMIAAALEHGITLIDTAEGYGCGLAETYLGKAMTELQCRDQLTIVTKTGPLFGAEASGGRGCNLSKAHILQRVEGCLTRLQTDRIDVLLAHWPDVATPISETMEAADELQAAGKILHFGVSNFPNQQLGEALACGPVVCNQLPCSLADRSIEDGRRQFCLEHKVGIMAYSPIGKGILSGKYDASHLPPSEDYRHTRPHFSSNLDRNLQLVDRIRDLASDAGVSPVAIALAWTIHLPGITTAIPGAKSVAQLRDHAEAARLLELPDIVEALNGFAD